MDKFRKQIIPFPENTIKKDNVYVKRARFLSSEPSKQKRKKSSNKF